MPKVKAKGVGVNASQKPAKPNPDFPLFAHASGKWAKKIKGKLHYFGRWDDPQAALDEYHVHLGKSGTAAQQANQPAAKGPLTLERACFLFLESKQADVDAGKLAARTFRDYVAVCRQFTLCIGRQKPVEALGPADFTSFMRLKEKTCGPVTRRNLVMRLSVMLKWLEDSDTTGPIRTGTEFRKPSDIELRRNRIERGKMLFQPDQIRLLLNESGVDMRAMILLALNGAFLGGDLEQLPTQKVFEAIETGWLQFPRVKTAIDRRCWLWTSTRKALQRAAENRIQTDLDLFFVQKSGLPYVASNCDITKRFRAIRGNAGISRGGFSWLRKTFATAAAGAKDREARDYIMGHADSSMSALYVQEVWDERLVAVSDTVRRWAFAKAIGPKKKARPRLRRVG